MNEPGSHFIYNHLPSSGMEVRDPLRPYVSGGLGAGVPIFVTKVLEEVRKYLDGARGYGAGDRMFLEGAYRTLDRGQRLMQARTVEVEVPVYGKIIEIPDTLLPAQTPFGAISVQKQAQTLTLDEPSRITGMSVWVRKFAGNPTDLVVVTLYGWDGGPDLEAGIAYASAGIDNGDITGTFQNIRVDAAVDVPAGQYALVLERAGALSNSDFYATQHVLTGNYSGGTRWTKVNGVWGDGAPADMLMTLWGQTGTTVELVGAGRTMSRVTRALDMIGRHLQAIGRTMGTRARSMRSGDRDLD